MSHPNRNSIPPPYPSSTRAVRPPADPAPPPPIAATPPQAHIVEDYFMLVGGGDMALAAQAVATRLTARDHNNETLVQAWIASDSIQRGQMITEAVQDVRTNLDAQAQLAAAWHLQPPPRVLEVYIELMMARAYYARFQRAVTSRSEGGPSRSSGGHRGPPPPGGGFWPGPTGNWPGSSGGSGYPRQGGGAGAASHTIR